MPSPNIVRQDINGGIYHVYSRGVNKLPVLKSESNKIAFIGYLDRYLSPTPYKNRSTGGTYPNFNKTVTLLAYAIMDNHFHLLLKQSQQGEIAKFMKCLICAYVSYSNSDRNWIGPAFQSRFKAKIVMEESYWLHISKYIHRNPRDYKDYDFSSFQHYTGSRSKPSWLNTDIVISTFGNRVKYEDYVHQNDLGSDPRR